MPVLITGAAAGLARGIATSLAEHGFGPLAVTFRSGGTPPDATLAAVRRHDERVTAHAIDFFEPWDAVETALQDIVSQAGPFSALVHAVGPMTIKRFEKSGRNDYAEMLDGNLRSAVQACAAVLPGMRKNGKGRIVFFGLNGSGETRPAKGLALHAAAKSGLVAFARTLALEEAKHAITVNVVEPGDIRDKYAGRALAAGRSANNPRGRPGSWEDVADIVRFFLDEDRDFVTGSVVAVNGGLLETYERSGDSS
jgi:3-oxoacyl-[acyl-carrier protein] reductase